MKNKKINTSISFQILPDGQNHNHEIEIIDKVIELVKKSSVKYEVGPMETTMEGELKKLFEIVEKAQKISIKAGAESVFTNVKILYNPNGVMTIDEKVTKYRK